MTIAIPSGRTRGRSLLSLAACAAAWLLVFPSDASAHLLPTNTAKQAIRLTTKSWFQASDLTSRYWVDGCHRHGRHRVDCKAHIRGRNVSLGATETCTKNATARLVSPTRRSVRVTLGGATTCRYSYGDTGGGPTPIAAPPAPDTAITSGPAEGSTVPTGAVTFGLQAIGGEDPMFECSVDGGPFMPCMNPTVQAYNEPGPHTFAVRAISIRLGTVPVPDPTPATRSFIGADA